MSITFVKAERRAVKLKAAIDGPSGSGKTEGALELATAIVKKYGGRIAVADTEPLGEDAGAASLYADRYDFDHVLIPNATPATMEAVIDAAIDGDYTVLVLDTVSHSWQDILDRKEQRELDRPTENRFAMWGKFGPEWDRLIKKIVRADIHIICTMRSKQTYQQVGDGRNAKIEKLGMQPQVRDGSEYEFSLVFSVNMKHRAIVTKGRAVPWTVDEQVLDLRDAKVQEQLIGWMENGGKRIEAVSVVGMASDADIAKLRALAEHDAIPQHVRKTVCDALDSGRQPATRVAKWIDQLTARIATPTPSENGTHVS